MRGRRVLILITNINFIFRESMTVMMLLVSVRTLFVIMLGRHTHKRETCSIMASESALPLEANKTGFNLTNFCFNIRESWLQICNKYLLKIYFMLKVQLNLVGYLFKMNS